MKFLVINGSPKGDFSVTVHTVLFLQEIFKDHEFKIVNVGQQIRTYENDINKIKADIEWSDAIVYSYPVYTFIAPSQLHRFIELLKESKISVKDKFVTQITTSKHFYDMTAHKYVEDNSFDMKKI